MRTASRLSPGSVALTVAICVIAALGLLFWSGAVRLERVSSPDLAADWQPIVNAIYLGLCTGAFAIVGTVAVAACLLSKAVRNALAGVSPFWLTGAVIAALAATWLTFHIDRPLLVPLAAALAAVGGVGAGTAVYVVWRLVSRLGKCE